MTALLPTGSPLVGPIVRLDPLTEADVDDLATLVADPVIYSQGYVMRRQPTPGDDARDLVRTFWLSASAPDGRGGGRLPYAVRLVADSDLGEAGTLVGTSSFAECDLTNESAHVGWTLYGSRWWGTPVNPAAKLLLLSEAFDNLGYGRVRIQTDVLNTRSQAAIAKLGATREGILRRERRREDGTFRDTVVFSVIDTDWPSVKAGLEARIA